MKKKLKNYVIIIPLHIKLGYPCDYLDQTTHILSKNNLVIFFDFNNPSLWLDSLKNIKRTLDYFLAVIKGKKSGEIYFRPFSFFPTQNINLVHKINRYLGIVQLKILLFLKRKNVIVWGFDPLIEPTVGKLGEKISIYDCVDYLGEDEQTKKAKDQEKKLFNKVNYIAFNSQGLFEKRLEKNKEIKNKAVVTFCGCAYDLYQAKNIKIPEDFKKIKGKKIILAGNLDYRLDIKLLQFITDKNPDLNFIFIGSILKDVDKSFFKLLKKKNVHYLGEKNKTELPNYYKHSELGIIPYKTSLNFVKYSHPMKTYEYLASGIPVVSTVVEALKNYPKDIIFTTDDYKTSTQALQNFINNWDPKKALLAKRIALKNSWENKVAKIEEFIINNIAFAVH